MSHNIYESDLKDAEWKRIAPLLRLEKLLGSKPDVERARCT
ncbi:hypothetical protein [Coleofasciculus sp. H7-2]